MKICRRPVSFTGMLEIQTSQTPKFLFYQSRTLYLQGIFIYTFPDILASIIKPSLHTAHYHREQ